MKKLKLKTCLLSCLMVFSVLLLSSFTFVTPDTIGGVIGCAAFAGAIPAKMMLNFKMGTKRFKSDGGDGGGGAGESEEDKLLGKIKKKIQEATAEYETRMKALEKTSEEYKQLEIKIKNLETFKANLKEDETVKTIIAEFAELNTKFKAVEEKLNGGLDAKSVKSQVNAWIEKNKDEIKRIAKSKHGTIELELKAADVMTTGSATNPDGIPELVGVQMAPPSNINLRDAFIDQLVTTLQTSLAAYPYTEVIPKDGDYAFLDEAEEKPLIDFKIETRYAEPKKIAAHMELTEEAVTDIPGLQSIANDFLRKKHALKRQRGILFGDGAGANPKGVIEYGRPFTAGAMAGAVTDPNFMDVVNAAITDIFTTHNYQDETPYMANIVMVSPIDFFTKIVAAKDENGLPLYPMASLFNKMQLGGAIIIPFEDIQPNEILVADLSKYNVTNYVPYSVRIGWINDQFITNQFCIVGESRFHAFVKKLDEQAFIWDNIDRIEALLDGSASS